ncbi:SdiA-regulated domain-containing protein [Emticicia soli]|uniref:SdiA-regulated domain-containing protein n=1 Tax=Emticicia soli TaxID=2027878 RepID=A0ABW5J7D1_9BACT
MNKLFFIRCSTIALMTIALSACGPSKTENKEEKNAETSVTPAYDFTHPAQEMKLAKSLKEISGLSYYKDNLLMCINDEEGKVFIYDFAKEAIIDEIKFGKAGDYEGIELVGEQVFVMKSNGKIKVLSLKNDSEREIDCTNEDVVEYEGLGYDASTNSLLIATKEHTKTKDQEKMIYSYSLAKQELNKRLIITKNMVTGQNGKADFRPSGIAVHPLTNDIYIVASQGKKLLVLTKEGAKKSLIELDDKLFRQPEGICFTPDGNLYIASEGGDKKGYILSFMYK